MKISLNAEQFQPRAIAVWSLFVLWFGVTFSLAITEIALTIALAAWLFDRVRRRNFLPLKIDWTIWGPLSVFFILVLFSFVASEYPKQSMRGVLKIGKYLLLFMMVSDLFADRKVQKRFSLVFLFTFLIVIMDASFQYAFGKDLLRGFILEPSGSGPRISGGFVDYSKMAAFLILVLPMFGMLFVQAFLQKETRKHSFFMSLLVFAGLVLLFLTRSRGAMLAFILACVLLFLYRKWFKALGITCILLVALFFILPKPMLIHLDAEFKEQSLIERFHLWQRAWDVIDAKPWVGTGINTYAKAHSKYDKAKSWRVRNYYAHNGYLQLAAETGVPCLISFLIFVLFFVRRGMKYIKSSRDKPGEYPQLGILTGCVCFLIFALSDTVLQSPQPIVAFWFFSGLLLAYQKTSEDS